MPENKKKYTGAWCPSITPFDADGKLDLAALEKHFSRLSEAGTDGVLLMGSIGEFTALSMDERVSLIHAARTMTHLPLIANVSGTCMEDMTRLADAAYSEGYEAVMALPHYYFAQTPRQLEAYFDTLGGRFEGEWLIYNFPARTGCDVDAALIAKLAARFPRFMGVKDTVDCASHTRAIVRAAAEVREDFSVLCGFDEYFIPNLMNGGDGVLSGAEQRGPRVVYAGENGVPLGAVRGSVRGAQGNRAAFVHLYDRRRLRDDHQGRRRRQVRRAGARFPGIRRRARRYAAWRGETAVRDIGRPARPVDNGPRRTYVQEPRPRKNAGLFP